MIAPNDDRKIGRNEPCPCGKTDKQGKPVKYKDCCLGKDGRPILQPEDMRTLLHVLLTKFQQVTKMGGVVLSAKLFEEYPKDAKFNVQYVPEIDGFRFWVDLPQPKGNVIGPRRLVLPNR